MQEKNIQTRQYMIQHTQTLIDTQGLRWKKAIDMSEGLDLLTQTIKKANIDPNTGIRDTGRATFWSFHNIWKDRADGMAASVDGQSKKLLEKASPSGQSSLGAGIVSHRYLLVRPPASSRALS